MPVDEFGNRRRRNKGDDLLDALNRLIAGRPRADELLARKNRGTLRINVSTVSMEAGCSRTLIGSEKDCAYRQIRDKVLAAGSDPDIASMNEGRGRPNTHETLRTLRDQLGRLLQDKVVLMTRLAETVAVAKDLERQRDRAILEARNARRVAQGRKPLPARDEQAGAVVPFHPGGRP